MRLRARISSAAALVFFCASLASCVIVRPRSSLPPGQAKKLTGQQSASSLAPGKNK